MTLDKAALRGRLRRNLLCAAAITVLTLADQLLKLAAASHLQGQHKALIPGVLGLTYVENTGAAFSMLAGHTTLLSVGTLLVLLAGAVLLFLGYFKRLFADICAVMILAGGLGNLIDRFAHGYVVDYIETLFVDFPVYNFADILVVVGVFSAAGYLIWDIIREAKEKKRHG